MMLGASTPRSKAAITSAAFGDWSVNAPWNDSTKSKNSQVRVKNIPFGMETMLYNTYIHPRHLIGELPIVCF